MTFILHIGLNIELRWNTVTDHMAFEMMVPP